MDFKLGENAIDSEKRKFIIKQYHEGHKASIIRKKIRRHFNLSHLRNCPTEKTIRNLIKNYEKTGRIDDLRCTVKPPNKKTVRTENFLEKLKDVHKTEKKSMKKITCKMNGPEVNLKCSKSTVHKALRKDLGLKPYKKVKGQKLKQEHKDKRVEFCREMLDNNAKLAKEIIELCWETDS